MEIKLRISRKKKKKRKRGKITPRKNCALDTIVSDGDCSVTELWVAWNTPLLPRPLWIRSGSICLVQEGSYLPSNRNSPKSEQIENAPLAILISTEQF